MAKKKVKTYTEEELAYINNRKYNDKDTAFMINRSTSAVTAKRYALDNPEIIRETRRKTKTKLRAKEADRLGTRKYDYWTDDEILLIMTSKLTDEALSLQLGRTTNSIQKKRHRVKEEMENRNRARLSQ